MSFVPHTAADHDRRVLHLQDPYQQLARSETSRPQCVTETRKEIFVRAFPLFSKLNDVVRPNNNSIHHAIHLIQNHLPDLHPHGLVLAAELCRRSDDADRD